MTQEEIIKQYGTGEEAVKHGYLGWQPPDDTLSDAKKKVESSIDSLFSNFQRGHDDPAGIFQSAPAHLWAGIYHYRDDPKAETLREYAASYFNKQAGEFGEKIGTSYPTISASNIPWEPSDTAADDFRNWYKKWQAGGNDKPLQTFSKPEPEPFVGGSAGSGTQQQWEAIGAFPKGEDPQAVMKEWMDDPNKRFNKETGQWEQSVDGSSQTPEQIAEQIRNTITQIEDIKSQMSGGGKDPEQIKKEIEETLAKIADVKSQMEDDDYSDIGDELGDDGDDGDDVVTTSKSAREIADSLEEDEEKSTQEDIDSKTKEVEGLTLDKQIQDLKTELGMETEKPAIPTFADDYEALRSEYGIAGIESQINTLDSQIADKEAALRQGMYDVEGELKPMELIGTEQRELQRQAYEQIDALNRRKQTLVDELSTKQTLISNLMQFKQLDYNTASAAYQQEFTNNINLLNIIENRASAEEQRQNQQQDDARANLNTMINMMGESGKIWSDLDNAMKTEIVKLEMKGNLPIGTIESFMNTKPDAKLLATKDGYDADGNAIVSFIYEDKDGNPGVVKTVKTGGVASGTGGTGNGDGEDGGIDGTGLDKYAWFDQVIALNPDGDYDELYNQGRRVGLSISEITRKLSDAEIKTAKEKAESEKRNYTDEDLRQKVYSLYQRSDTAKVLSKSGISDFIDSSNMTDADKNRAKLLLDEIVPDELNSVLEKVKANPDKYRINNDGIFEKVGFFGGEFWSIPGKNKKVWSFNEGYSVQ